MGRLREKCAGSLAGFQSGGRGFRLVTVLLHLLEFRVSDFRSPQGRGLGWRAGMASRPFIWEVDVLKKSLLAVLAAALGVLVIAPGASAASGGGCQLQGTANISPGLNTSAQAFTYNFGGSLSGCQSTEAGAPTAGTVSAGQALTVGGQQFQEPVASGNGGCGSSTTSGIAIVSWADGTNTVVQYTTTGALAAVQLQGTVIASVTLPAINPAPGQPTSTTVSTTRYAGGSALGTLAFQPPDPTACTTPTGVTQAGISGSIGLGSS